MSAPDDRVWPGIEEGSIHIIAVEDTDAALTGRIKWSFSVPADLTTQEREVGNSAVQPPDPTEEDCCRLLLLP